MSTQDPVVQPDNELASPETESTGETTPDIVEGNSPKLPDDLIYTNEGFEQFLQQAELSGISRQRQDELIAMFLAQDVPLETIILDTVSRTVELMRRNKLRVLVLVVVLGLVGFVGVNEYRAKTGHQEYQPWQFEISARLKLFQVKVRPQLFFLSLDLLLFISCWLQLG
jgi:hypothetical protein